LNAAIEAARAGEAGAFCRSRRRSPQTAEHSRNATKDIAALIKAIQAELMMRWS